MGMMIFTEGFRRPWNNLQGVATRNACINRNPKKGELDT